MIIPTLTDSDKKQIIIAIIGAIASGLILTYLSKRK